MLYISHPALRLEFKIHKIPAMGEGKESSSYGMDGLAVLQANDHQQEENYAEYQQQSEEALQLAPYCSGCGGPILDNELCRVAGSSWHAACLRCHDCQAPLLERCFFRDGAVYCRQDFCKRFGVKICGKCSVLIKPDDLVMVVGQMLFHVPCFTCTHCDSSLTSGDQYGVYQSSIYCRPHFEMLLNNTLPVTSTDTSGSKVAPGQAAANGLVAGGKRNRTCFNSEQVKLLKMHFARNQKPDQATMGALSDQTGLEKRTLQIWFQNARAKLRRNLHRQEVTKSQEDGGDYHDGSPPPASPTSSVLDSSYSGAAGDEASCSSDNPPYTQVTL